VRLFTLLVLLVTAAPAAASPYDLGWGKLQIGLGPPPVIHGDLGKRTEPGPCGNSTCQLSSRFAIGGGLGRWGFELQVAGLPIKDTWSMDWRDRSRDLLMMWGPHARYSIVRRFGVDLSVRGGIEHGNYDADDTTTTTGTCTAETPHGCSSSTYDPPSYGVFALSVGASVVWRVRMDGGFMGIQADFDATVMRASYPDHPVYGAVFAKTFGIVLGSMFDLK
jgi:hypothetical protein